ncbi:thermonuclease family protein [Aurantimonas sp. C2-6-R+9]|uniref:thermonuclease family protein n=1 Tax=unclassified Aurantimonas TaxID=2638230 RepID=UPI002E171005|nr:MULTISPECIES: thermonuclease family protein [unclassified Aurantimonas]MEC5292643.1 thermonuclease family protein [Aurantimonas sp. C2-3-R2]MEC5382843.1 thermonuclease family protein [Aurantimonas sp. C2-6-R+9]MEC5413698.1 thermonuclease family protein [Aurantimonas sp. C2-4-R8]
MNPISPLVLVLMLLAPPAMADAIPVCSGGDRAARKLTCIVDGDTGWERGVKWRALDVDTPEISQPECAEERRLGLKARERLRQLMAGGYRIEWTGGRGRYGRELANVILSDGRDAGQVLIEESLSQPWPNEGNRWCGR